MENMAAIKPSRDFWENRKVLVTGGAGFIGSWLCQTLLHLGARVIILDIQEKIPLLDAKADKILSKAIYIKGDVRKRALVESIIKKHDIQTIFHLAAQAIVGEALKEPGKALDINVKGTWTILETCRSLQKKHIEIIVASSDKAYGAHSILPYKEEFALLGINPYDCSKSCADRIAQMYAKTYRLPVCITRCGNVYGGGDFYSSRLIPDTIRSFFYGRHPQIRSDGLFQRDYIYIKDIVSAYICTAESLRLKRYIGEVFNFGNNKPYKAIEVVQKIGVLMNTQIQPVILSTAQYEIKDQFLDATKAEQLLGWKPRFSLERGLKEAISWYKKFFQLHGEYSFK